MGWRTDREERPGGALGLRALVHEGPFDRVLGAVGEEDGLLGLDEIERVLLEAFLREQLRCGAEAVGVLWAATGEGQRRGRRESSVAGAALTPPPLRKHRTQAVSGRLREGARWGAGAH